VLTGAALGLTNLLGQTATHVRALVPGEVGGRAQVRHDQEHPAADWPLMLWLPSLCSPGNSMPTNVDHECEEIEAHITLRMGAFMDSSP
jgi:RNA-binding protein MEX3